jgi:hypothetical protein
MGMSIDRARVTGTLVPVLVSPAGLQGYDKIRVKYLKEGCTPSWRNREGKKKERNLIRE